MKKTLFACLCASSLLGGKLFAADVSSSATKPNIVVILADDMGFSDLGCYGSEISTPNLDALAANGVRFTQFYNTARCCPTRAALLTGLYSHQAGMGGMISDSGVDGYRGDLNDRCVTIPEVLRPAGYATYAVGKWHLTKHYDAKTPVEKKFNWPLQRGFDHFFGCVKSGEYFHPKTLARDNTPLPVPAENYYNTDAFVDNAIQFVNAGPKEKPFFLYVAFTAPHWPLQAPPADIAKYRGKYKIGWDKLREQRYAKQISLGIVDKAWPLSPRPDEMKAWDSLTPAEQDRFDQIMSIYAACVDRMDQAVGRLVAALKQRGVLDNTLILFLSDNGGSAEGGPDGILEGLGAPGSGDSTVYCGESWATLANNPFRRYKQFVHEGGIATPLIAHWPAQIAAKGELRSQPGHVIDLMATCVDVAGAKYPGEFKGKSILPMEGKSLVPAFANQTAAGHDTLFWEHLGNAAARAGDWKLVRLGRAGVWELYNLKTDRTELHNLAAQEPARVKELAAKWEAWAERAQVKPYPSAKTKKEKNKSQKTGDE